MENDRKNRKPRQSADKKPAKMDKTKSIDDIVSSFKSQLLNCLRLMVLLYKFDTPNGMNLRQFYVWFINKFDTWALNGGDLVWMHNVSMSGLIHIQSVGHRFHDKLLLVRYKTSDLGMDLFQQCKRQFDDMTENFDKYL